MKYTFSFQESKNEEKRTKKSVVILIFIALWFKKEQHIEIQKEKKEHSIEGFNNFGCKLKSYLPFTNVLLGQT